jgi:hypothetical protein
LRPPPPAARRLCRRLHSKLFRVPGAAIRRAGAIHRRRAAGAVQMGAAAGWSARAWCRRGRARCAGQCRPASVSSRLAGGCALVLGRVPGAAICWAGAIRWRLLPARSAWSLLRPGRCGPGAAVAALDARASIVRWASPVAWPDAVAMAPRSDLAPYLVLLSVGLMRSIDGVLPARSNWALLRAGWRGPGAARDALASAWCCDPLRWCDPSAACCRRGAPGRCCGLAGAGQVPPWPRSMRWPVPAGVSLQSLGRIRWRLRARAWPRAWCCDPLGWCDPLAACCRRSTWTLLRSGWRRLGGGRRVAGVVQLGGAAAWLVPVWRRRGRARCGGQ